MSPFSLNPGNPKDAAIIQQEAKIAFQTVALRRSEARIKELQAAMEREVGGIDRILAGAVQVSEDWKRHFRRSRTRMWKAIAGKVQP